MRELPLLPFKKDDFTEKFSLVAAVSPSLPTLQFHYKLAGPISKLHIPEPSYPGERVEGLYHDTCFEAFLLGANGRYLEWNFSPSGDWCLFAFDSYRKPANAGISLLTSPPTLKIRRDAATFEMEAKADVSAYTDFLGPQEKWKLGLTTVVKMISGYTSYWSLQHSGEKPDFHRAQDFLVQL